MGKREREYDPARTLRRMRNFVVAVLLAVLAWLLLSRAYAATRADNALDELYYSTLDSRSCEALWEKGVSVNTFFTISANVSSPIAPP